MSKQFEIFLSQLSETNATLESFTDFEKVSTNVSKIELKLNQLNYLIGKEDLNSAIKELFDENPKTFDVLEILVAVRKSDKKKVLNKELQPQLLDSYFTTIDGIYEYFEKTGLAEIFRTKKVKNLVDYVFGVEVGLDTNARKNRGGHNMENAVAKIFTEANIPFKQEVNSTCFVEIESLGEDLKRFDFVIETPKKTYLIETNFYNGGGSKLNETARSYSDVAPKINKYKKFEFVWITDGQGWFSAKNKLEEAFSIIPSVYNLTNLNEFIEKIQKEIINQ
ncbi:restriction endonuclease [Paludibacter sp. 221]|uniref:type II restriction endonuclease n=1 Tax=Paludibacter sp. 221 TaxID=2302939 RepID=UPI0013D7F14E|nr:type II restriction endonuclease [Paludibacter sp. 221]NDV47776.1 restriction endonuclease [Paludibacter sp. 221]